MKHVQYAMTDEWADSTVAFLLRLSGNDPHIVLAAITRSTENSIMEHPESRNRAEDEADLLYRAVGRAFPHGWPVRNPAAYI